MSTEVNDMHGLDANNIDNSDVDDFNLDDENTRHSILDAFLRCINLSCCLKKKSQTIKESSSSEECSVQSSDEGNSSDLSISCTNNNSSLSPNSKRSDAIPIITTPQSLVIDRLIEQNKESDKTSPEDSDRENGGNVIVSYKRQFSHESDGTSSIHSITTQSTETDSLTSVVAIGEISNENLDSENVANSSSFGMPYELFTFEQSEDCTEWDNDYCHDSVITTYEDILITIKEDLSSLVFRHELYAHLTALSKHSVHKKAKLYLLECNFIRIAKTILKILDEPWIISVIIEIIINMCCNDEMIDFIGNDKDFVILMLSHFKYPAGVTLTGKYVELLSLIAKRIQRDPQSPWSLLMNYEYLGITITEVLQNTTNDDLTIAESLLRFITEISTLRKNFLQQVFNLKKLFFALLTFFIHMIPEKEGEYNYSFAELLFINSWLILMTTIERRILFKDYNGKTFPVYMEIMYRILKPYNELHILAPELEEKSKDIFESRRNINILNIQRICNVPRSVKNISIIRHSVILLTNVSYGNNVPNKVESILINIIYHLKITVPDFDTDGPLEKKVKELLGHLIQHWIRIVENYDNLRIYEILYLCKPETRECLIDLIRYDSNDTPSEILQKVEKVLRHFDLTNSSSS